MADQLAQALAFSKLHVKSNPVILYNAWDGGSAKTIAGCGAQAIALGDHPVGFAHGFDNDNFNDFTFDMYLPTILDVIRSIGDLPLSVDINNAYGLTGPAMEAIIKAVLEAGAVGINFEDRLADDSGVQPINEQVSRIKAIRAVADEYGLPLFINARTDLFAMADKSEHANLLDGAVERATAYADAGANGFFAPGLMDLELIKQLCNRVDVPVNIIRLPGAPGTKELAAAGVARISYGPVPQIAMTAWLKEQATTALNTQA